MQVYNEKEEEIQKNTSVEPEVERNMGKFSVGDKDCTDKDKDIKERYVPKCNKGMGNHRERSL